MMEKYLFVILTVAASVYAATAPAYAAQIAGYKPYGFLKTNKKARDFVVKYYAILTIFCLILLILPHFLTAVVLTFAAFFAALTLKNRAKFLKSFRFTKRGTRLMITEAVIAAAEGALFFVALGDAFYAAAVALPLMSLPNLMLALFLTAPLESAVKKSFVKKTAKIIKESGAVVVGVTGSYAKSSVKSYLAKILSEKYRTYETVGNFNTPMGLSLSVKNMPQDTEIFVVEMGARKTGDIEEMCRIARPKHGVITGIAPQHLETFLSLENIMNEKGALARCVPRGGKIVSRDLDDLSVDAEVSVFNRDFFVTDVILTENGTTFSLDVGGKKLQLQTPLLGRHNAENVALAAVMALNLGVSEGQVAAAVKKLEPLPHRLSVEKRGGITVIDDSYNANPKGVRAALEVLKMFGGRKVAVTPGLVELGKKEEEENVDFGKLLAHAADVVILTGGRTSDFVEKGLMAENFKSYFRFNGLSEAEKAFSDVLKTGDVVLFSNDLPDNYD